MASVPEPVEPPKPGLTSPPNMDQDAAADDSSNDSFDDHMKPDPDDINPASTSSGPGGSSAQQKRRRVTRACDECRRKKIKCDGKNPCTHCTVYSYDCTYDQPSNRRRNPAPQVVEALEKRLRRAEALLRALVPNLDINDPSIDAILAQGGLATTTSPISAPDLLASQNRAQRLAHADEPSVSIPSQAHRVAGEEPDLESMVGAAGQLDLDERGNWDYHGHSSGLSFLRRMRQQFGDILGPEKLMAKSSPFMRTKPPTETMDSPRSAKSAVESPRDVIAHPTTLPSREKAMELCSDALDDAATIMKVCHQPSFYKRLDRIYSLSPDQYVTEDQQFLPLLYSVMALGCLFGKGEQSDVSKQGYETVTEHGFQYFWAARQLMDITDCRDLTSLQAIIFMTLFLQCSAKLSTCYAYIGVALRSAIRMGLHRSFRNGFTPIEAETRKRCFWTTKKMDAYVGALLGLPQTLADEDIDQDYPAELDDEYITETGYLPMPAGKVSIMSAAVANYKLMKVVAKIVRYIYPIKGFTNKDSSSSTYRISYCKIRELEDDLQVWLKELPTAFQPGGQAGPELLRARNLIRINYAQAQMMLYRPFLHYVSSKSQSSATVDQRSYACSAACVSVSRNVVHITAEMKRSGLLVGSYWFTMYTTFFAILSLIFYALENPHSPSCQGVLKDAREGQETLASLAKRSMAADRCTGTLQFLFSHIDKAMANGDFANTKSRKRQAPDLNMSAAARGNAMSSQGRPPNIAPRPQLNARMHSSTHAMQQQPSQQPPFLPMTNDQGAFGNSTGGQYATRDEAPTFLPSQLGVGQDQFGGDVADLSAMMFPSADPFAYPNPPMLTLEQNYPPGAQRNPFVASMPEAYMPASNSKAQSVSTDDHIDVQLFGPLPPHMAHQQFGQGPHQVPQTSPTVPNFGTPGMGNFQNQMFAQQLKRENAWNQRMSDSMTELLSGEDWQGQYPDI